MLSLDVSGDVDLTDFSLTVGAVNPIYVRGVFDLLNSFNHGSWGVSLLSHLKFKLLIDYSITCTS